MRRVETGYEVVKELGRGVMGATSRSGGEVRTARTWLRACRVASNASLRPGKVSKYSVGQDAGLSVQLRVDVRGERQDSGAGQRGGVTAIGCGRTTAQRRSLLWEGV